MSGFVIFSFDLDSVLQKRRRSRISIEMEMKLKLLKSLLNLCDVKMLLQRRKTILSFPALHNLLKFRNKLFLAATGFKLDANSFAKQVLIPTG